MILMLMNSRDSGSTVNRLVSQESECLFEISSPPFPELRLQLKTVNSDKGPKSKLLSSSLLES